VPDGHQARRVSGHERDAQREQDARVGQRSRQRTQEPGPRPAHVRADGSADRKRREGRQGGGDDVRRTCQCAEDGARRAGRPGPRPPWTATAPGRAVRTPGPDWSTPPRCQLWSPMNAHRSRTGACWSWRAHRRKPGWPLGSGARRVLVRNRGDDGHSVLPRSTRTRCRTLRPGRTDRSRRTPCGCRAGSWAGAPRGRRSA